MIGLEPPEPTTAPTAVECPCGNGYAEPCRRPTAEPSEDRRFVRLVWHYRHPGCWVGGHVVVERGRVVLEGGPLFDPDRFDVGEHVEDTGGLETEVVAE